MSDKGLRASMRRLLGSTPRKAAGAGGEVFSDSDKALSRGGAEAEVAWWTSEDRYRLLFENMLDGFAYCEMLFEEDRPRDFRYLVVNRAFEELTGLKDVEGKKVSEVIPGIFDVHPELFEIYGRVSLTGRPERFEIHLGPLDTTFSVSVYSTERKYFTAVFDNITVRRRAEDEVRELSQRLTYHVENSPLAVIEWGPDMRLTRWSREAERIFGWRAEEVLGKRMGEFRWVFEEDAPQVGEVSAQLQDGRDLRRFSANRNYRKDGSIVHCEWYNSSLLDSSGKLRSILSQVLDVSERKEAEERLRLHLTVLQSAANGIVITGKDGTIQWVNPAFTRLTGYSAAEAIGNNPRVLKSGRHEASFYRDLWDTILAGRVWRGEIVNKRKDGSLYNEEMTITPVADSAGSITHFVAIKNDVTERKSVEERLRELNETLEKRVAERTAEAERRSEQLKALASELSQAERRERLRLASTLHDHLQQVLVATKLNLEALQARFGDENVRPDFVRVAQLLDESITWCRSVTVSLSPPILQEAGLAGALSWLARQMQEQHGLRVDLSMCEDGVEPPDADLKAFLFEAVRELLRNVIRHSGERAARVVVRRGDGSLEIRVEDAGKGFDRRAVRVPVEEGAPFGLFSIQQRLEMLGGSMSLDSAPGRGTRVTLRMRIDPGPASGRTCSTQPKGVARTEAPAPAPSRSDRVRVLIADDHRIFRQGFRALLGSEQWIDVVGEAADGAEAVELARALRPDVVVMDVSMPKMSGIEATRQIVAELPEVRVIGLSMHEEAEIAASMREAGAVDFVTKGGPSDAAVSAIHAARFGGKRP